MPRYMNEKIASEEILSSGNKAENTLAEALSKKSTRLRAYKKFIKPFALETDTNTKLFICSSNEAIWGH